MRFSGIGVVARRGLIIAFVVLIVFGTIEAAFAKRGGDGGKANNSTFVYSGEKRNGMAGASLTDSNGLPSFTVVVDVSEDAYVSEWDPEVNYGFGEEVRVGNGGLEYRGYLKFDLSRIPEGSSIVSAKVRLDGRLASNVDAFVGAHYLADDDWNEATITWNNCPTSFSSAPSDVVQAHLDYMYWEVGEDVNVAYNGDGVYSVVLKMCDSCFDKWAYFYSRDTKYPDFWPILEVECAGIKYGGGGGTAEDPYLVCTAEQMIQIADNPEDWDKHFRLIEDIDLSGYTGHQFHIISKGWQEPFMGVFDGGGHVISNFSYIIEGFVSYVGLFGCLGANSEVSDLGLEDPNVSVSLGSGAGALAGLLYGGVVRNCWARGVQVSGGFRASGLVGEIYEGQLVDSYVDGGYVFGQNNYVGGLVGQNNDVIARCYSTCRVDGASEPIGGLVGYTSGGSVIDSFWDEQTSELTWSWGGTGKTTAEMQTKSTFTDAGWDFVGETANGTEDIWRMCVDGLDYPRMAWEFSNYGDFVCPDGVNFLDFAVLGSAWLSNPNDANWNPACDIFVPNDNIIDELDLAAFTENWLTGM
jgi:hypothetical protein